MIKVATRGVSDHTEPHTRKFEPRPSMSIARAATTARNSTRTEKTIPLFVSVSFVNIPKTLSILTEEPARRSYLERQVVGGVASPEIGGGQVAVSPSHATSTLHATVVAYYGGKGMYVRWGTKLANFGEN